LGERRIKGDLFLLDLCIMCDTFIHKTHIVNEEVDDVESHTGYPR